MQPVLLELEGFKIEEGLLKQNRCPKDQAVESIHTPLSRSFLWFIFRIVQGNPN